MSDRRLSLRVPGTTKKAVVAAADAVFRGTAAT